MSDWIWTSNTDGETWTNPVDPPAMDATWHAVKQAPFCQVVGQTMTEEMRRAAEVEDFYRAMHAVAPVELVSEGERQAIAERDEAYGYLRRLFEYVAPQCIPLPDLMGICTQIDNVLAGARIQRDEARTERDAARAELMAFKAAAPTQPAHDFTRPSTDDRRRMGTWRG